MIVQILPCRAHGDWGFTDAVVTRCDDPSGTICIVTGIPLTPGEQFLLKLKRERVCIANYDVTSCRREGNRCEIHARFAGFVSNPASLSAVQLAAALAA